MTELLQEQPHGDLESPTPDTQMRRLLADTPAGELPHMMDVLYHYPSSHFFYAEAARTIGNHHTEPYLQHELPPTRPDALEAFMAYTHLWDRSAQELAGLEPKDKNEKILRGVINELFFYALFAGTGVGFHPDYSNIMVMTPSSAAADYHGKKNAVDMNLHYFRPNGPPSRFNVQLKTSLPTPKRLLNQYDLNNIIILTPNLFAPYLPTYTRPHDLYDNATAAEATILAFVPYKRALHQIINTMSNWASGQLDPDQAQNKIAQGAHLLRPIAPAFLQYAYDRPDYRLLQAEARKTP